MLRTLAKESEASPNYTVLTTAKYSLEYTPPGCKASQVFLGLANQQKALDCLLQVIDNEDYDDLPSEDIRCLRVKQRVYTDLKIYYERNHPRPKKEGFQSSSACDNPNAPTANPDAQEAHRDVKLDNELASLREKNVYLAGERKKYQVQFYSKYSQLAKVSSVTVDQQPEPLET